MVLAGIKEFPLAGPSKKNRYDVEPETSALLTTYSLSQLRVERLSLQSRGAVAPCVKRNRS